MASLSASRATAQPFAAAIMDVRTGEFLWETDNAGSRLHPASLTKMMTLYIVFEAIENGEISLDARVRISRHAAAQPPSRLGLRAGQTIALRYLIRAAALRSANDAAAAIAEALEGSVASFSTRMNRTAAAIGMTRTRFANPHGLTAEGHLSSARDMSRLGRQLYFDFPQYYGIFSRRSENAGIATVANTNGRFLDSYRGADGIKTGFTNAAGYNLTAMAERDGVRILVTVMGASSGADRLRRVSELMDRGFQLAPRRAATRAPGRPSYVRAPEDRGSGPAAGRVIRLQPAPARSPFPRPRPEPGQAPSDDLIAALRSNIDEVIDEIREPDASADTDDPGFALGETSEEPEEASGVALAAAAPERSPVPPARPETVLTAVQDPVASAAEALQTSPVALAAPQNPDVLPASDIQHPAPDDPAPDDPALAMMADAGGLPSETLPRDLPQAGVTVAGDVVIPGLPPISMSSTDTHPSDEPGALVAGRTDISPVPAELRVDDDGRLLWRDEELLAALRDEDQADPVLAPAIVLFTTSVPAAAPPSPMPEIVARSTSGGRLWRVELGLHGSRFDAERALLELALSESTTLGTGVRRVTPRGGRFAAEVDSLDQAQAELACARLSARGRACSVIAP